MLAERTPLYHHCMVRPFLGRLDSREVPRFEDLDVSLVRSYRVQRRV